MVLQNKIYKVDNYKFIAEEVEVQNNNRVNVVRTFKDNKPYGRLSMFNSYEKACKYAEIKAKELEKKCE